MPPLNKFKRFDVRSLLRDGIEPFPEIFARVNALGPDDGLIVVAPFLPSPLVERLAWRPSEPRKTSSHPRVRGEP